MLKICTIQVFPKEDHHNHAFDWVIDVIMNLDPSNYIHFIKSGEIINKKAQLPKADKKQMPTSNKKLLY